MPSLQQQTVAQTAQTMFFGSQVGGDSVINVSYTDQPFQLLWYDIRLFFRLCWATPWIVLPLRPCDSGELDELSLTPANMWCVAVHILMLLMQTVFILCIPVAVFFPIWMVATGLVGFFSIHWVLCRLLNGSAGEYTSDERYAKAKPEHAHEQWIFLNGVAVGEHWMKSNLNRLALTFGRPILGVHNQTNGILFDVIECLIQRNFQYANYDIRTCYKRIKEKLYDPRYSKVVFILHSQGGIEGGLVLDWLLQELPQDLLGKLEVYTFGCAANHFNSPHRHVAAQVLTRDPSAATVLTASPIETQSPGVSIAGPRSSGLSNGYTAPPGLPQDASSSSSLASSARTLSAAATDRAIGHIEHYAHQTDFVAMWGVLHFATSKLGSHEIPRFIGRLFVGNRGGHQFCQHYLDGMFPLARHPKTGAFVGAADESDFMNSVVQLGVEGDAARDMREAFEISYLGTHGFGSGGEDAPVEVHGSGRQRSRRTVRVKDLSRLWLYRNGKSPKDVLALPRNATM